MNTDKELERIMKKYKIEEIGSGVFREGFKDGIKVAEKYYKKKLKQKFAQGCN